MRAGLYASETLNSVATKARRKCKASHMAALVASSSVQKRALRAQYRRLQKSLEGNISFKKKGRIQKQDLVAPPGPGHLQINFHHCHLQLQNVNASWRM